MMMMASLLLSFAKIYSYSYQIKKNFHHIHALSVLIAKIVPNCKTRQESSRTIQLTFPQILFAVFFVLFVVRTSLKIVK